MEVLRAIRERRSVRRYTGEPVRADDIDTILDAARWAPSGSNAQRWRFFVVTEPALVAKIHKTTPGMSPGSFSRPAAIIVVCSIPDARTTDYVRRIRIADCAMAVQNMLLASHSLGLGACVVASYTAVALRQLLDIEDKVEFELMVTLGHPEVIPPSPGRLPLAELVQRISYGEK